MYFHAGVLLNIHSFIHLFHSQRVLIDYFCLIFIFQNKKGYSQSKSNTLPALYLWLLKFKALLVSKVRILNLGIQRQLSKLFDIGIVFVIITCQSLTNISVRYLVMFYYLFTFIFYKNCLQNLFLVLFEQQRETVLEEGRKCFI